MKQKGSILYKKREYFKKQKEIKDKNNEGRKCNNKKRGKSLETT
jgi:hypothetical protein